MENETLNEKQKARQKKAQALAKALNQAAELLEPGERIDSLGNLGLILKRTDGGFVPHPEYVNEGRTGQYQSPFSAHRQRYV